ncbi:acetoacetyl-CoA reductase [Candidatus Odyssella thessalonicensis]|uniref:acetoacetyl-CoA reductase n=1 Tax=Candidatus Odyssella thessalonicensis TaxID=84647 RepID=UPI000225C075|nr:acetoacetyl-CoA reductase [Candidatus Odyssella thessalonicensis]
MAKVAVVTGGTRGIGAAISMELHRGGYKVIANYASNDAAAQDFAKQHGIEVMKWDVGNYEACQRSLASIEEKYGAVDVLVNNAGITRDGFMHKTTPEMWEAVITTNLTSCFNMAHCVINGMRLRGVGRIINIASINGQKGQIGQVNYSAAKAGVIGFTKALALECANKGITVNVIAPGYIDTDMVKAVPQNVLDSIIGQIPVGRLGTAEEIAHVVNFLAGEGAGFITGSTITANGGQYMV